MKEKELIEDLVKKGLNNVEIGNIIGINRNTVRRKMSDYGIIREVKKAHPNLIVNYFEKIDSKEKAYWLGFLYADGYVDEKNGRLSLDLSKKDLDQVERFCKSIGANEEKIKERIHKCGSESVSVKITSRKFVNFLVEKGCTNNKSFTIKLLDFKNEKLDLSFLLGFYDGDGYADATILCCGSYEFLNQIKLKYELDFEVKKKKNIFILTLGSKLKRKMLLNYENSIERKKLMCKGDRGCKTFGIKPIRKKKFEVSKMELEDLIKNNTYVKIGKIFGVSDNAIKKRARILGIKLIPRKTKKVM